MFDTQTNTPTTTQHSNDQTIFDLLGVVWDHKGHVVGSVAISILLGTLYLFCAEPTYQVGARMLVQPQGWPLDDGARARHEKEFLATQAEIISSPSVLGRALAAVKQPITTDPDVDPMLAVLGNLGVRPVTGTNVVSVTYRCKNSSAGIGLVQAILESYQQFLQEMSDGSRLETLGLLTRSEEGLRSELEDREKHYRELRKQSPLIGQGKDAAVLQTALLERLGESLNEVRDRRIDLQNRLELMTESSGVDLLARASHQEQHELTPVAFVPSTGDDKAERAGPSAVPSVQQTQYRSSPKSNDDNAALDLLADVKRTGTTDPSSIIQNLHLAEVRQKELAQVCGPKHPKMRAVQEQVAAWKNQLHVLNNQAPVALQREISAAQIREQQLGELYEKELEKAKANDDSLVKEAQELDAIERLKTIHNSIIAQLNDWHLVEPGEDGGLGTSVVILEAPTIGSGPVWPKKSVLLALSASLGLLGGIGMIVVLKRPV